MGHRVTLALREISASLAAVAEVNPAFMGCEEKAAALLETTRLEARLAELRLRMLAVADDVAEQAGARSAGDWLAHRARHRGSDMRADQRLAHALDRERPVLAAALRSGQVHLSQARVIARALDELPADTPASLVDEAEAELVRLAERFGPTELARLGRRILEVVAPDVVDDLEGKRLAQQEKRARERQRLAMRACGDGTTRLSGLLPDPVAARLAAIIDAYANPRRDTAPSNTHPTGPTAGPTSTGPTAAGPTGTGAGAAANGRLPYPRRAAEAFARFLEAADPGWVPVHGGDTTTLVVTLDLDTLRSDHGTAVLATTAPGDSADRISASEARRLACNAQIIPTVLGGNSEVLDLGRARRLFTRAQRRALLLTHPTCQSEGCDIPGTWCEAHHWLPWSHGGPTNLHNATLLCSTHHHRAHDPTYQTHRLPNGDVRFTRRQ